MTVRVHKIKVLSQYFEPLKSGIKTLELRKNDRDYRVGDFLYACEWNKFEHQFTGKATIVEVTHIVDAAEADEFSDDNKWLNVGHVAMSVTHPSDYKQRIVLDWLESNGELVA